MQEVPQLIKTAPNQKKKKVGYNAKPCCSYFKLWISPVLNYFRLKDLPYSPESVPTRKCRCANLGDRHGKPVTMKLAVLRSASGNSWCARSRRDIWSCATRIMVEPTRYMVVPDQKHARNWLNMFLPKQVYGRIKPEIRLEKVLT